MYAIAHLDIDKLQEFTIPHQATIIAKTGAPLELEKAYQLLKEQTANFSKADPKAQQIDQLLVSLLPDTFFKKKQQTALKPTNELSFRLRIKEQERLRILQLIALENAA